MGRPRQDGVYNNCYKHGMARTVEYKIWCGMKFRCYNPTAPKYKNYGGRGICICEEWKNSFTAFFAALGPRPPGTILDRIDNNGDYEPGNVRWTDMITSNNNRRNTREVLYRGQQMPVAEAMRAAGVIYDRNRVYARLRAGWTIAKAVETPERAYG